jgi:hypothetical protein
MSVSEVDEEDIWTFCELSKGYFGKYVDFLDAWC